MTALHFLTFGGGQERFLAAANRLASECKESGIFSTTIAETHHTLEQCYPNFWKQWKAFCLANPKMFGFGIWKPFLILQHLRSINVGDTLLYLDAGCVFRSNARTEMLLQEITRLLRESAVVSTDLRSRHFGWWYDSFEEHRWTKTQLFERLNVSDSVRNSPQRQGGILILRKCQQSLEFCEEWFTLSAERDGYYISECDTDIDQDEGFIAHRHEQSTFSTLSKLYGFTSVDDFSWQAPLWFVQGRQSPIWAPRWISGSSFAPWRPGVVRMQCASFWSEMRRHLSRRSH